MGDEDQNMTKQFESNPRDYALALVESGAVDASNLLLACLKYLSHDDVREMLDANELSPRFISEFEPDWDRGVSVSDFLPGGML